MTEKEIEKRIKTLNKYCKYVKKKDWNFYILWDNKMTVSNSEWFYFCDRHYDLDLEPTTIIEPSKLDELNKWDIFIWFSEEFLCYRRIHIFQWRWTKWQIYASNLREDFWVEYIGWSAFIWYWWKNRSKYEIAIFQ